jgi:hypothetical protein
VSFVQHSRALGGAENVRPWDLLKEIITLSLLERLHIPIIVVINSVEIARAALSFIILSHLRGLLFLDVVIVVILNIWELKICNSWLQG